MLLSNKEGSKQQPQKPISKLILTLLAPKYHQYEYCPEKYVLDRIVSTNMWSGTNHKTIKQMLLRITTQYNNVSYHNITHAFDVATTLDNYLQNFGMCKRLCLSDQDQCYMILAAYAHDCGHQGLSNQFYKNSYHQLAINYYFQSPLENMHASKLMDALAEYELPVPTKKKQMMIELILYTDNSRHGQLMKRLSQNMDQLKKVVIEEEYRFDVMTLLLHLADLNVPSKEREVFLQWYKRLSQEFDKQTVLQHTQRLTITFKPHPNSNDKLRSDANFMNKLVLPLYKVVVDIETSFATVLHSLRCNIDYLLEKTSEQQLRNYLIVEAEQHSPTKKYVQTKRRNPQTQNFPQEQA